MSSRTEEIRDEQRSTWNLFSAGWKKWDVSMREFLRPAGEAIIRSLHPEDKQSILDIASGTGEPALTIAALIPQGHVMLTDLAGDMLVIARENAESRGLHNTSSFVCDVSELPFPDSSYHAVSCRFGFMFFPDMARAAGEIYRVLMPGGKLALTVWDIPENNFWITAMMGTIQKHLNLPPNPSGEPGMFRCCKPGLMENLLQEAGFKQTHTESVPVHFPVENADTYWNMLTEMGAPIVAALKKASPEQAAAIRKEVYQIVTAGNPEGKVNINGTALLVTGVKE